MALELVRRASHRIPASLRRELISSIYGAPSLRQWLREVMNRDVERVLADLDPRSKDAVEVSGELRSGLPWRTYRSLTYPEFDVCRDEPPGVFDVVICEQVLEHVDDPFAAATTLRRLAGPGGVVLVSVPFLLRIHGSPGDYWRFTPAGLEVVLRRAGLEVEWVRSWGNRAAARRNLRAWLPYRPWRSLRDESDVPLVVWALAMAP